MNPPTPFQLEPILFHNISSYINVIHTLYPFSYLIEDGISWLQELNYFKLSVCTYILHSLDTVNVSCSQIFCLYRQ